jgi:hypothetical protein
MATNDPNRARPRQDLSAEPHAESIDFASSESHEEFDGAEDEVLVLNMDEEQESPARGVRGTYGAPPEALEPEPDEFSELGARWEGEELATTSSVTDRRKLVAAAVGAAALVGVLAFVGGDEPAVEEVATAPSVAAPAKPRVSSRATTPTPDEGREDAAVEPAAEVEMAADGDVYEGSGQEGAATSDFVAGIRNLLGGAVADGPFGPQGEGFDQASDRDRAAFPRERREGVVSIEDQVVLPGPLANIALVDSATFKDVWTRAEPPAAGVLHASYVQTPFVGPVRVHTPTNEFFEGELVGLGAGRLVLRTPTGQLTLGSGQVQSLERIVSASASTTALAAETTGERVRVRVAGGWLRGEVVREHGDSVTLLLDSGGRITVERRDVLPAETETTIRLDQALARN